MFVVIDTNILVSALWARNGAPARIVAAVLRGELIPCFDHRMLAEYWEVLLRPKFAFTRGEVSSLLGWFEAIGKSVTPAPVDLVFSDESDKKFFEVARFCNAILITGNLKHFPEDPLVMSVSAFLERYPRI